MKSQSQGKIQTLIDRFGVVTLAELAGVQTLSAVRNWRARGQIPARRCRMILTNSKARGLPISADDLI